VRDVRSGHLQAVQDLAEIEKLMKVQASVAHLLAVDRVERLRDWLATADTLLEAHERDEERRLADDGAVAA
jgi:hypothetical protein